MKNEQSNQPDERVRDDELRAVVGGTHPISSLDSAKLEGSLPADAAHPRGKPIQTRPGVLYSKEVRP